MANFQFKKFKIEQDLCGMKVGTDGVLLGAWASGGKRILDIGTGTGLIALMMAQRYPEARIDGIDIDANACRQAQGNVLGSPFVERVLVHHARLQEFESDGLYDAIVSNPPFFVDSLKNPDKSRSLARHTDSLSFSDLLEGVKRWLSEDGVFSVILPIEALEQFTAEAYFRGFYVIRKCGIKTVPRKPCKRYLLAFSKHRKNDGEEQEKMLMDSDGQRSEWYADITKDFYIR